MKKLILIPSIIIGLIALLLFGNSFIAREKLYYIPQTHMYLKTIYYPKDEFGYILFGKDSTLTLCSMVDYIAVGKQTGGVCATILINPNKKDELNFLLLFNSVYKKNQVHYKLHIMKDNLDKDTTFYEKRHLSDPLKLKQPYIDIQVNEFFESVFVTNYNDKYLHELKPLN